MAGWSPAGRPSNTVYVDELGDFDDAVDRANEITTSKNATWSSTASITISRIFSRCLAKAVKPTIVL